MSTALAPTSAPQTTEPQRNTNAVATIKRDGKRMEVRGKLKVACDSIVWDGLAWDEAARKANFTVQAMRQALSRPHVMQYLREQKQVFRASVSGQNISVLAELRDKSGNGMVRLGAVKLLEQVDEQHERSTTARTPGVVIQIINTGHGLPRPTVIDANPLNTQDDVGHDE